MDPQPGGTGAPDRGDRPGGAGGRPPTRPPGTLRIGQVAGVDVLVRSSWLLVALLIAVTYAPRLEAAQPGLGGFAYVGGLAVAVLLYLSVLLHELSHALMAKRFGLPVRSITLHFLGGVTEIEGEPDTPGREFGVSVVGPLTSIAVGLVFIPVALVLDTGVLGLVARAMVLINLFVGVLNLVPGLPLDGGRVLRAVVWRASGDPHRGTVVAGWGGRVAAVAALVLILLLPVVRGGRPDVVTVLLAVVIAAFLWSGATQAIVSAKLRARLPMLRARALGRRTVAVPHDLPLAEAVRRAGAEQAGSILVLDHAGDPQGIVNEAAVVATPEDRRPWLPVSAVARSLDEGLRMSADLAGEPLVRAMQATPASEYLLLERDGTVFGVLVSEDVDRAFASGRGAGHG